MDLDNVCPTLKRSTVYMTLTDCTKLPRSSLAPFVPTQISLRPHLLLCITLRLFIGMWPSSAALSGPNMLQSTL